MADKGEEGGQADLALYKDCGLDEEEGEDRGWKGQGGGEVRGGGRG